MCIFCAYIFYVVLAARATDVLGRRNLLGSICNFVCLSDFLYYIYYLQVPTNVVTFSWTL